MQYHLKVIQFPKQKILLLLTWCSFYTLGEEKRLPACFFLMLCNACELWAQMPQSSLLQDDAGSSASLSIWPQKPGTYSCPCMPVF